MPRIRILKNYDTITNISESDEPEESSEYDFKQTKGWWSNSNIIASFTDAKLKQAIFQQKEILSLLEQELVARKYVNFQTRSLDFNGMHQVGPRSFERSEKKTNKRTRIEIWLKRSKLSLSQSVALNEAWSLILKEFYNGK